MAFTPVAAFTASLAFSVAFRFVIFVHLAIFMQVGLSRTISARGLRLGPVGEASAAVMFVSGGLALAGVARQAAALVWFLSALVHFSAVLQSLLATSED